jgi:hypothetical protein
VIARDRSSLYADGWRLLLRLPGVAIAHTSSRGRAKGDLITNSDSVNDVLWRRVGINLQSIVSRLDSNFHRQI